MIKVVIQMGKSRTLFIGLDRTNTDRLHNDEPIMLHLGDLLKKAKLVEVDEIVIFADETLDAAYHQLDTHIPGVLPPFQELEQEK